MLTAEYKVPVIGREACPDPGKLPGPNSSKLLLTKKKRVPMTDNIYLRICFPTNSMASK